MRKQNIRNIAIISHVDHGKTTLVDGLLKQSGIFRENQNVEERIMDSMDLEKERGITIMAKNTAISYKDVKINIVDTPGHADFGGEVERSLNMVDGAILLVDASEGPLPQTRFVVKNVLEKQIPVILVINKIDRSDARIEEVINDVYDLFIDLDAGENQLDFSVLYTNAKAGIAHEEPYDSSDNLRPLFDMILSEIPGPEADDEEVPQFLVTNLDYDPYVGQIAVGRLVHGVMEMNQVYALCSEENITPGVKFSALYTFEGLSRKQVERTESGDIIAVAGVKNVSIGDTISSVENPRPLAGIHIEEPTVAMIFYVNSSPSVGKQGKYLTYRHLSKRLERETLKNVALKINPLDRSDACEVCGRGELQMAVLIETIRREGYEFMVSKPRVITRIKDDKVLEPVERLFLDIPEEFIGVLTENMAARKGRMVNLTNKGSGRAILEYVIPARGLISFRNQFLTETKGSGVMNTFFEGYEPWFGKIPQRMSGALVADRAGRVTAYASLSMEDRGELFVEVGTEVYGGMIVGERNRKGDLNINITKEKKLTNIRSSTAEATVTLRPPRLLSLDQAIEFIAENELVEIKPETIRMRKMELDAGKRVLQYRKEKFVQES